MPGPSCRHKAGPRSGPPTSAAALGLLPNPRTTSLQSLQTPGHHTPRALPPAGPLRPSRALRSFKGSSGCVDPELFSSDAQLLCQIVLVVLLLFMLCILLHCLAVFDPFWKCCQQGRNSPSYHLCHQLKTLPSLLNPYYSSNIFH